MNKLMMTLAFATLMGSATMAQDTKGDGAQKPQQLTEQMTTRLKLNDDQKAKVSDINTRYANDLNAARKARKESNTAGDHQTTTDDRAALRSATEKKNAELKQVLTPEQMTEWQKMQSEMRAKAKERMEERHEKNQTKTAE